MAGTKEVKRNTVSEWDATLLTLSGGASYEGRSGSFFFRPSASLEYLKLDEDGYTDTGGGDALDLTVDARNSDELAANGGMAVGFDVIGRGGGRLLSPGTADRWFRVEAEGGWREIVAGSLGATRARFEGGTAFTLDPDQTEGGWYARLRGMGGGELFEVGGEAGAEDRNGQTAFSLRGSIRVGF